VIARAKIGEKRGAGGAVERVLLVINRASGTGHGGGVVDGLRAVLGGSFGGRAALRVEVVEDHPAARRCVAGFLEGSDTPALVVAGGGSGTLHAVIEGLCEGSASGRPPGRERVLVGALRMGSGNPLARQFGAPRDPEAGLRGIIENLRAGRTAPCCVIRCEVGKPGGGTEVRYAATMAGFGQFGRAPGDLERWHRRLRTPRAVAAGILGVERVNNAEYVLSLLARSARCARSGPSAAEVVEARACGRKEVLPLLAGAALSFPFGELPVDPGTRVEEEALSLYLAPFARRSCALRMILAPRRLFRDALRFRIEGSERAEIRLLGRDRAEFFLDEDPVTFHSHLTLEVAGSLTFVPGPEYAFRAESGVAA
jgi:Diacylglycerol kinase catalytic domain